MIETATQLLEQLWRAGAKDISTFPDLQHPVLIGDMWEGLSRSLVDRTLFQNLDLRVATGKIRNKTSGELSRQIDCMIVRGPGQKIPFTDQHIYDSCDVISVVEVKKTLGFESLKDAMRLLHDVSAQVELGPPRERVVEHAWRGLSGRPLPTSEDRAHLSAELSNLYDLILLESAMPLRIVWGHGGYKTEGGLRKGFARCVAAGGFWPYSLTNLVIAGPNVVIKTNGMPYQGPLLPDGRWVYYCSQGSASMRALLEVLWTRLSYMFKLSSTAIFGEDLDLERVVLLYTLKYRDTEGKPRWDMRNHVAPDSQLGSRVAVGWRPHEITACEYNVLCALCEGRNVQTDDRDLIDLFDGEGPLAQALDRLNELRLVYVDGVQVRLLTEELSCVISPDGKFYAADNYDGRLSRWVTSTQFRDEPDPT